MFFTQRRARAAMIAGVASAALLLTSCADGGSGNGGGTDSGSAEGPHFIYITSDPIGQNEFLKSGKTGIENVAEEFDGTQETYESKDDAQRRQNVEAAISKAPEVIVMLGFQFQDIAAELAEQNPQQKFLLIDAASENAPENLYQATFREQEPSYLLGVEAGMLTEANKVGSVISLDIPLLQKYSGGFAEGAKSANPEVDTVAPQVIGGDNPFADTARAKEQAIAFAGTGVDQVFAVGAAANGGIMEAAAEKGFSAYGVDANQCPMAPGSVVDGTIKAVDKVVETVVGEIMEGKTSAEATSSFGLKEEGMTIVSLTEGAADSQCTVMDHPDVLEKVEQTRDDIVSGKIEVTDPTA
ncbi:BMP family ABC transporter substrate-binding protein [Leucobacter massiliensis]|uniref:BMP family ABC transporter substrate-binding protein n=1 Tax=Leucobacter massiliensis TaxID=1686285 RepID=A0A2S9QSI4_9MICO|nr:BMP family ABC transporter substrate-binding protein [Leucobacter massiliensis]PRI12554.1 BMP family ABC transporter substrate-binding protein [Leucobacter massiliensis]PRI12577.1 BMP family ABC transporter substrate-binding protein [Leucobacter massiliensis]